MQAFNKTKNARYRFVVPSRLIVGMFIAFVILMLRIAAVGSPIMASDEYAYFETAKYVTQQDKLYSLDPGMQQVDNKAYPKLYDVWSFVSPDRPALVGRIFNALCYVIGALLLYGIFIRLFDRRTALISALIYLIMPFSFYATTLLPEVEFQLFIYALAYIWASSGARPKYHSIAIAAAVSAVGYLIKPHAVAAIVASMAYLFLSSYATRPQTFVRSVFDGLLRAVFYVAFTFLLIRIATHLWDNHGVAGGAMVSGFYESYLTRLASYDYLSQNIQGIFGYFFGHIWILLMLFSPGMFLIVSANFRWLRSYAMPSKPSQSLGTKELVHQDRRVFFALFFSLLMVAMLLMVAAFTNSAGSISDFEKYRLHGRYLEALLPFLLAYSVWACSKITYRYAGLLALLALVTFTFFGRQLFKIYPWDYPDIFGFYTPSLLYWSFDGALDWTIWGILACGVVCWILYFFSRYRLIAYVVFIVSTMLISNMQMSQWTEFQTTSSRLTINSGQALKTFMGNTPPGSGVIFTSDRYGETASLLMALGSLQHVKAMAPNSVITNEQVPKGVSWVVAKKSDLVDLPSAAELHFGNQNLYLLDGKYQWPEVPVKPLWSGKAIEIGMGASNEPFWLHGFNDAEEWGSWTRRESAYVELPARVSGKVVVKFFGWVLDNHPDFVVTIKLGESVESLKLTNKGADYQVVLDPQSPTDRLYFETKIVKPAQEARGLGVAVARVMIEKMPVKN